MSADPSKDAVVGPQAEDLVAEGALPLGPEEGEGPVDVLAQALEDDVPHRRPRAFAMPDLRPYLVARGGGRAVRTGTVVLVRKVRVRAAGGSGPAEGQKRRVTGGEVLATVFVGASVAMMVVHYLEYALLLLVVLFVPAAYFTGVVVHDREERAKGWQGLSGDSPPGNGLVGDTDPVDQTEREVAEAGEELTEEEEQIAFFEWVRELIGSENGVHLRTLVDHWMEWAGEGASMAQVREELEARGIPVLDQVKVAGRNRPGVHRSDIPEDFTPLPVPGGAGFRLLQHLPRP